MSETREEERELRQVARLIYQELGEAMWMLHRAVATYEWWPYPSRRFPEGRWREFGHALAARLEAQEWLKCTFAYEDIREFEARIDEIWRSQGRLTPFAQEDDIECRRLAFSVDEAREVVAERLEEEHQNYSFDTVAAMQRAAMDAARRFMPESEGPFDQRPRDRARMKSRTSVDLVAVALIGAPLWRRFEASLPKDFVLTAVVATTPGSSASVLSTLGDKSATSEFANRFVPEDIRNELDFEDFAFIVDREQLDSAFDELPPEGLWAPGN